jgi:hypothetical protein
VEWLMQFLKTKDALMVFTSAAVLFSFCAFAAEGDEARSSQHAGVEQSAEPEVKPESKPENQNFSAEAQPQPSSQPNVGNTARIARQASGAPPELVKGLEQVRLAPQTLESIERAFKERGSISRQEIPSVVAEIRQKDPSLSEGQAQQLRKVIDSKVANLSPDKVGPQISAAARQLLEQGTVKGASAGSGEGSQVPVGKDGKPLLDSDFFSKKDEKSESGDKASGKRSDVLDAIQLLLAAKGKEDKEDKDDKGKRDTAASGTPPQPLPPPPGGDRRDEEEDRREDPFAELAKNLTNNRRTPPPASNSSSSDSDKKKDKEEDSSEKSSKSSKKEKLDLEGDQLSKLEEELKAKELEKEKEKDTTLQPPAEDLLAAAKGLGAQGLQVPPNKISLPSLPPPMPAGAAGLPAADPNGVAAGGGGGLGGGGVVGGGGGGGGMGGSSFQGDPFGSVGFEPGGAPASGFNYSRLAEFGSSNGGSESASMPGDGYGGSDYSNVKRAFAMADEIKTYPSDEAGTNIVERFYGTFENAICGAPEAGRVGVCEKAVPKRATSEQ